MDLFGRKARQKLEQELENEKYANELLKTALKEQRRVLDSVEALTLAVGRIIALKEPYFGVSEDDPARKAESDRLGEAVIKRIKDEAAARRQMER